jgi:imidazole glycerol-phosphate synthase subunit HisH
MGRAMIAIVDYDIGNLGAVASMLHRLGEPCRISAVAQEIGAADRIILPGNGAFDACMRALRRSGLLPTIERRVLRESTPLLGICVGAQMLGTGSEEGNEPGLGWLPMRSVRFPSMSGLRVPHMGWNEVWPANPANTRMAAFGGETRFYFVHSYRLMPEEKSDVLLWARYGVEFAAAVARDHIVGVQFHPEKSHRYGKQLLAQFARGEL